MLSKPINIIRSVAFRSSGHFSGSPGAAPRRPPITHKRQPGISGLAYERVKKVFLTRSQTENALLVSRLKRLASCCAHNLCAVGTQIPHLQDVKCFVRGTRPRTKQINIFPPCAAELYEVF